MLTGIVDQLRIFLAASRIQHKHVFLRDHLREADDGVKGRAQFVAHVCEKASLGRIRLLSGGARQLKRLFLNFSIGDLAQHRDDFGFRDCRGQPCPFERPTAHFDPDKIRWASLGWCIAPNSKFNTVRLAAAGRIRERGEIGGTVGDVDAIEQPVTDQCCELRAQHRFRCTRNELNRAVPTMTRDHIAHVAGQQTISVFLDIEQREACARQRLGGECKTGSVKRGGRNSDGRKPATGQRVRLSYRQRTELSENYQQRGARECQDQGKRDDSARCGKRCFERNNDEPDRGKGFHPAGGHGQAHRETCKGQRGQHVRTLVVAGSG